MPNPRDRRLAGLRALEKSADGTPEGEAARRAADRLQSKMGPAAVTVAIEGVWQVPLAVAACEATGCTARQTSEDTIVFSGPDVPQAMALYKEAEEGVLQSARTLFKVDSLTKAQRAIVMLGLAQGHLILSAKLRMMRNPGDNSVWTWAALQRC